MHKSTTPAFVKAMAISMVALATWFGFANSGAIATAQSMGTSSKVFYAADCSKQELFRTRPAPGAILPGEKNYDHISEEVVDVRGDGTQVLKNAIIIHPDGSITLPEAYHDTPGVGHSSGTWYCGTPYTRWNDGAQKWDIVYDGPFVTKPIEYEYQVQPYVDDEGVVHVPGSDDYHPELYGMWGFVPPVLRPEGYVPGEPWPEPLDWSKLDELTAKANGTSWDSTTVFDRWADGTKIYGNGLILHPNGVYHTPSDWVDHDEEYSHLRYIHVYFDEQAGEWSVYYTETELPVPDEPELGEPPVWNGDETNASTSDGEAIWSVVPDVENETDVVEPVKAEDSEPSVTNDESTEPDQSTTNDADETDNTHEDKIGGVVDTSETRDNHLHDVVTDIDDSANDAITLNEADSATTEESLTSEMLSSEGQISTIY